MRAHRIGSHIFTSNTLDYDRYQSNPIATSSTLDSRSISSDEPFHKPEKIRFRSNRLKGQFYQPWLSDKRVRENDTSNLQLLIPNIFVDTSKKETK